MKVMTVLGTRPEIIRLSIVIEKLDSMCEQVLVHTGQNYDRSLNEIFFDQLKVRQPDYFLGAQGSLGEQLGVILTQIEQLLSNERPDKFLILGDTNSALSAIIAKRMAVPVYHMEAGNRCYDDRVPEEVNRRIIDHCSDVLMPYTERSRQNLIREGIHGERIYVTGNPILEVLTRHEDRIQASNILEQLKLKPKEYFLVTMHRSENVDIPARLENLLEAFDRVQKAFGYPVVVSTHPHTRERLEAFQANKENTNIRYLPPFGLFDFIRLEQNAFCVLSDSGTVQEECAIFKIPNVTIRDVTERPETLECGSNILSGISPLTVLQCVKTATAKGPDWEPPREYLVRDVSSTVIKIVLGHLVLH
jgi:UDP-N-acetylglucosamine 2-epimerase (non-hydrolysing)